MLWIKALVAVVVAAGIFWLANKSQDVPLWLSIVVTAIPLIAPFLYEDDIKTTIKAFWQRLFAYLKNGRYVYSLLVKLEVSQANSLASIFSIAENHLKSTSTAPVQSFRNGNTAIYKIQSPPISIQIRILPTHSESDETDSGAEYTVELSCVETLSVSYRDRGGEDIQSALVRLHETGSEIYHKLNGSEKPEILVTVNKLKDRRFSQRPFPPESMDRVKTSDGVVIQRDEKALQVFAHNISGVMREIKKDLSSLQNAV